MRPPPDDPLVSGFGSLEPDAPSPGTPGVPGPSGMGHPRTPRWGAEALWRRLSSMLPGITVEVVSRCASTNTELIDRVRRGGGGGGSGGGDGGVDDGRSRRFGRRHDDLQPVLLVAEHQTAGRGRRGKSWHATAGASLTFSLMLPYAPREWSGLSLAVGLAIAETLDPAAARPPALWLKWPNDLLLCGPGPGPADGRKLGGILIETVAAGASRMAVVGLGLNLRPQIVPESPWGVASLDELVADVDGPQALSVIAPALVAALVAFERDGFAPLRERFARRDALLGVALRTTLAGGVGGVGDGVDAQGRLWLRTPLGRLVVDGGDIELDRACDPDTGAGAPPQTSVGPEPSAGG